MSDEFDKQRRQEFLTKRYFEATDKNYDYLLDAIATEVRGTHDLEMLSLHHASLSRLSCEQLQLRYTAGQPIEQLRAELTTVIDAYERYQTARAAFEQRPGIAALGLVDIGDYERCMQLIGLCYLLHRRDLLPRIAALQDPAYIGSDALYEDLLRYVFGDRPETDEMLHLDAYDDLLGAMWAPDDVASAALLKRYVSRWYTHFKYVPWHNGHIRINDTEGDYFGYWAFEAGAVALLCDIDDGAIDHMVYPRDLVAWARANKALSESDSDGRVRLRCEGGQPCPQTGFWSTPAQPDSRRRFEAGELMPKIEGSAWGATIWYWDERQA